MADNFGRGLRVLGMKPNNNVCLYADTRAEWLIAAQASFQQSFPVVTIYTNLGNDGIIHALTETKTSVAFCTHDTLKKLAQVSSEVRQIKT